MSDAERKSAVTRMVLTELAAVGEYWVPVAVSSRHCHLCQTDLERLFGPGHALTPMRMLEQPGQFAAEEKVILETPKGRMSLRVVGPIRKETQVELSLTDARQLGLSPPIRLSGDLEGSPGCRLVNGDRVCEVSRGVIVAARHLHMSPEEAAAYGLKDGQEVSLRAEGPRAGLMEHVIIRSGRGHLLETHLDTDEANAYGLRGGQLCRVILPGDGRIPAGAGKGTQLSLHTAAGGAGTPEHPRSFPGIAGGIRLPRTAPGTGSPPAPERPPAPGSGTFRKETLLDYSGKPDLLLTEELLYRAAAQGMKYIRLAPDALVTPLARDVAWEKGIELVSADGRKEWR